MNINGSSIDERFKNELGATSQRARSFLNDLLKQTLGSAHPQMTKEDWEFPLDRLAAFELQRELWRKHHPMTPGYGQAVLEVQNRLDQLARADKSARPRIRPLL